MLAVECQHRQQFLNHVCAAHFEASALPCDGCDQKTPACSSNAISGPCAHVLASALQVALGADSLTQRMEVTNTGSESLKLTAAFHTYFSVGAIAQTKVQRLFRRQPLLDLE